MDRLERALEKARQERTNGGGAIHAEFTASPGRFGILQDIPVPAVIPDMTPIEEDLERHRIIARHTRSPQADVFRMLRTKVLHIMNQSNYRTLAITSPNYGDGKTTIALNLALSLALDVKQTVLLVDLDLRKPNLHDFLSKDPKVGLSNYLVRGTPLEQCMVRPPIDRFNTLPAGPAMEHSSEILASPKMAGLARELKMRYPDRIIIYDMPPVLEQDDPIAFLPHVDAVLMVVGNGVTKVDELKQSLEAMGKANVIGTVLNTNRQL
jgi:capsular exopolysaccharide synthesis family protein